MTIITQPITEKKLSKQQQEPLVKNEAPVAGRDAEEGRPVVVTMHAHVRRVSSTTTLCVFITALLVLTTGIIGGIYLYRQLAHYRERIEMTPTRQQNILERPARSTGRPRRAVQERNSQNPDGGDQQPAVNQPSAGTSTSAATQGHQNRSHGSQQLRHFRGWCTIPYIQDKQNGQRSETSNALKNTYQPLIQADSSFEQKFDIDIESEEYEEIEVPDFSHGRRGRFIHDFSMNKTGIIDLDGHRCFVMPLNRSLVLPPHSLFDLIVKMRTGYYDVDTEIVRETMQAVTPQITDFKTVGFYIARECAAMPTYRLERVTSPVFKRSVGEEEEKSLFREFAGNKVSEIKIVNIHLAVGRLEDGSV